MRQYTVIRNEAEFNRTKELLLHKRMGGDWKLNWVHVKDYTPVVFYYTEDDRWDGWDRLGHAEDMENRGGATRKDLVTVNLPDELFQM